jgi:hypothetical protein
MKLARTHLFKNDFLKLPESIKRRSEKALRLLAIGVPGHPVIGLL